MFNAKLNLLPSKLNGSIGRPIVELFILYRGDAHKHKHRQNQIFHRRRFFFVRRAWFCRPLLMVSVELVTVRCAQTFIKWEN